MATKNSGLSFKEKSFVGNSFSSSNHEKQFTNFNLNQNHKCSDLQVVQSKSISINEKNEKFQGTAASLNISDFCDGANSKNEAKNCLTSKNQTTFDSILPKHLCHQKSNDSESKKKKINANLNSNNSTLSLHISAYEKSIEFMGVDKNDFDKEIIQKKKSKNNGLKKGWKDFKQTLTESSTNLQNCFEYPRQQQEEENEKEATKPEIMQFKASQKLLDPNQKESKKEEEETQIVVREPIVNRPKPILNRDCISAVLSRLLLDRETIKSEELPKFMLSGKEPFAAGLRYLSTLAFEEIVVNSTEVVFKSTDKFAFPYDFPRLFDIINVVMPSIELLKIMSYPESDVGKRVLAVLICKGIKNIFFGEIFYFSKPLNRYQLPDDYVNFMKNECEFESICHNSFYAEKPTVTDVLMMKSAKHVFFVVFEKMLEAFGQLEEDKTFPAVLDLLFACHSKVSYGPQNMKNFLINLKRFPNLTAFKAGGNWRLDDWFEVYQEMVGFHPGAFNYIPLKVKGKIEFSLYVNYIAYEDIIEKTGDNVGIVVTEDWSKCEIIKEFEIHDGLTFKFKMVFEKKNRGCNII